MTCCGGWWRKQRAQPCVGADRAMSSRRGALIFGALCPPALVRAVQFLGSGATIAPTRTQGITAIGKEAFRNCGSIAEIRIAESATFIWPSTSRGWLLRRRGSLHPAGGRGVGISGLSW